MKRILITGKGSYIGTNLKKYLVQFPNEYIVEELDMMNNSWRKHDFSRYDVVYHVAGIAHSTPNDSQKDLYYKVNTDLTYEVAIKAKDSGIKQFIFMSSIIVYGSGEIGKNRIITEKTPLTPDNFYGDSKKQAEIKITPLENNEFKIVIVRPPMIYGPNSKGNYPLLAKFAKKTPVFPTLENKRSMLFLGNFLVFLKLIIDNNESGVFFPQNEEYVCSKDLIQKIAKLNNRKIYFTKIFNPLLKILCKHNYVNKVFGDLVIKKELSKYKVNYCLYSFYESLRITEGEK